MSALRSQVAFPLAVAVPYSHVKACFKALLPPASYSSSTSSPLRYALPGMRTWRGGRPGRPPWPPAAPPAGGSKAAQGGPVHSCKAQARRTGVLAPRAHQGQQVRHGDTRSACCSSWGSHLCRSRHHCQLQLLRRLRSGVHRRCGGLEDILLLTLLLAVGAQGGACSAASRLVQLQPQVSHVLAAVILVHRGELARAARCVRV